MRNFSNVVPFEDAMYFDSKKFNSRVYDEFIMRLNIAFGNPKCTPFRKLVSSERRVVSDLNRFISRTMRFAKSGGYIGDTPYCFSYVNMNTGACFTLVSLLAVLRAVDSEYDDPNQDDF